MRRSLPKIGRFSVGVNEAQTFARPDVKRAVAEALAEDVRTGDITTEATIAAELQAEGHFVARCGYDSRWKNFSTLLYDNSCSKSAEWELASTPGRRSP